MSAAVALMTERLDAFAAALAGAGITPGADKRLDFLRAVAATRPPSAVRLYWTARVTLLTDADDVAAFDRAFAAAFGEVLEATVPPQSPANEGEPPTAPGGRDQAPESAVVGVREGAGHEASRHEVLTDPRFGATSAAQAQQLAQLRAAVRRQLPRTRARRRVAARRGEVLDLRRVAAGAGRTGGEVTRLHWLRRPDRPRRVLMLIDVSGSLRATCADALRCAHALVREIPGSEAYTFGTRLTHVTMALRERDCDAALAELAATVADVNGGTRIGAALETFLADARRAAAARDAVVIVVSDGLERGDPEPMARAVARLSLLAHRLVWWTPLACDPDYRPTTRAMAAILEHLDDLVGVGDLTSALAAVARLPELQRSCDLVAARWDRPHPQPGATPR